MDTEGPADGDLGDADLEEATTDSLLEALLVEDAAIEWDPVSGEPRVARRHKSDLDSASGSA